MTTPDVPLRMEMTFELPGTPEQVWHAIATAEGNTAWFTPTDLEEREGGTVVFHMGEDMESKGTVVGWEPGRRLAYEEPDWSALAGRPDATVTPMVTEMLIEAKSGGTCVLRVVTSAYGTGADWENEFFDDMVKNWAPMFEHLRLYLTHFPGQTATSMEVAVELPGTADEVKAVMWPAIGVEREGQQVQVNGVTGTVEHFTPHHLVLRTTDPVTGLLVFFARDIGDGKSIPMVAGYLFGPGAPAYAEDAKPGWKAWLENLLVTVAPR